MLTIEDIILISALAGLLCIIGGNLIFSGVIKSGGRWKIIGLGDLSLILLSMVVVYGSYIYFWPATAQKIIHYKPPAAVNLVFWGLEHDMSTETNYAEINEFIKVTNSRVVLFGAAKNSPPPIDNVIGKTPDIKNEYQALRLWYDTYREELKTWKGGVVVFGLAIPVKPTGFEAIFAKATKGDLVNAKGWLTMKHIGIFADEYKKGLLCDFKTTNSQTGSGRRPLKSLTNDWRGL